MSCVIGWADCGYVDEDPFTSSPSVVRSGSGSRQGHDVGPSRAACAGEPEARVDQLDPHGPTSRPRGAGGGRPRYSQRATVA